MPPKKKQTASGLIRQNKIKAKASPKPQGVLHKSKKKYRIPDDDNGSKREILIKREYVRFNLESLPVYVFVVPTFSNKTVNVNTDTSFFMELCYYLEPITNRIAIPDEEGIYNPLDAEILALLMHREVKSIKDRLERLCKFGVLYQGFVFNQYEYYLNPRYAICGTEIDARIIKLFEVDDDVKFDVSKAVIVATQEEKITKNISSMAFEKHLEYARSLIRMRLEKPDIDKFEEEEDEQQEV